MKSSQVKSSQVKSSQVSQVPQETTNPNREGTLYTLHTVSLLTCRTCGCGEYPVTCTNMAFQFAEPGALGDLGAATVALLVWYYVALFTQSYAKIALVQRQRRASFGLLSYRTCTYTDPAVARLKYGVPHDSPIALTADRTAGNLSEQLVPFLASAWLRALLVPGAAASSGRLCYAYLVSRMVYPVPDCVGTARRPVYVSRRGSANLVVCRAH
jgi:hypothetical protein